LTDEDEPDNTIEIDTVIWGHNVKIYAVNAEVAIEMYRTLVDGLEYKKDEQKDM